MKSQQTAITATLQPVDSIGEALNLAPLPTPNSSSSVEVDQVHDDFEYARGNMINTIEKGNEALQGILDVAGMGQHPRAYEVAANLVKTMVEANKELLDLQKKKKEIEKIEAKANPQTVNNNLFVGSTAELLKALKSNNMKDIE
jgi:hypothetical protein